MRIKGLILLTAAMFTPSLMCKADPLGIASGFNLVALGVTASSRHAAVAGTIQDGSEVTGRVAASGTINGIGTIGAALNSGRVADPFASDATFGGTTFDLIAGGGLNSNETILSDGSAFVATSIGGTFSNTGPSVAFNHNGSATGGSLVTAPATDPINFADLQTQMQQQSAFLLSTQPTLTPGTPGQNNTTVLDASGGQSLYVFTITEAQFSAGAINVVTGGSNPTVVINVVDGAGGVYRAGGTFLYNGQQYFSNEITNHVLFNFPDATSLNTASGEFPASILAPYAALTASTLDGTIIVAQATSLNGEVHNIEFDGTLPTPTPPSTPAVPEPGTLALVGTGILSVAGKLRRKK